MCAGALDLEVEGGSRAREAGAAVLIGSDSDGILRSSASTG